MAIHKNSSDRSTKSMRSLLLAVLQATLVVVSAALTMAAGSADANGGCNRWQLGYHFSGLGQNPKIWAIAEFDDGTGPALYVGGQFESAHGTLVNNIARWDGIGWSALSGPNGIGMPGLGNQVNALAVFDDGSGPALFAGGLFQTAGGVTVNHIAKWDGTAWSALSGPGGTGTNSNVVSLEVFDDGSGPALYVGGEFGTAAGLTVNRIAKWDGAAWSALSGPGGTGTNQPVTALTVFDDGSGPALHVGGEFTTAGGVTMNHIAKWDGVTWSALSGPGGNGADYWVLALSVFDDGSGPALYAGGWFDTAGGVSVNKIAKWDGATWSALSGPSGTGIGGLGGSVRVKALAVFDDGSGPALHAGGWFENAGGVIVNSVAKWDGAAWSALSGPGGTGTDNSVDVLAAVNVGLGTALYAGGLFRTAGGVTVNRIASWDGAAWFALLGLPGAGTDLSVSSSAVFDDGSGPALYAGGRFYTAGGVSVNRIAKWDGLAWSALSGPNATGMGVSHAIVLELAVFDDGFGSALYAGGLFDTAGGVTVNHIARWDGAAWSALAGPGGTGAGDSVYSLAVFDDGFGPALYAGGLFDTIGGVTVNHIAKWDGAAWSALSGPGGTGADLWVNALAVFDDGSGPALYAGGRFNTAGGVTVNKVARWDGATWSSLSGPNGTGIGGFQSHVGALAVFDDGTGPGLFAGGYFTDAGGVRVNRIAKWDGQMWSPLVGPYGTGMEGRQDGVSTLGVFDDGGGSALYAGGDFPAAGGLFSQNIAVWRCLPGIFSDDFETGDTFAWSETVP